MHFQVYAPDQLLLFLKALALGACVGVFYDVFRILRIAVNTHSLIIFFEDIIFFIVSAVSTFLFIFHVNSGQIRWFIFLGLILGFIVYYFTLGKLVIKISEVIIKIVKSVFKFLFGIFIKPFVIIFRWIYRKINTVWVNIKKRVKIVNNNLRNRLKSKRNMLYNQLRKKIKKHSTKKGHEKGMEKKNDKRKRKQI